MEGLGVSPLRAADIRNGLLAWEITIRHMWGLGRGGGPKVVRARARYASDLLSPP